MDDELPKVMTVDFNRPYPMKVYVPKQRRDGVITLRFSHNIWIEDWARERGREHTLAKYEGGLRLGWIRRRALEICKEREWLYLRYARHGMKLDKTPEEYQVLVELDVVVNRGKR